MSSRKCCAGAGGLATTPPQGCYRKPNYHRLASKYPSLQNYISIRSSWPINIIILPPPLLKAVTENPTTIASTVTSDHLGLYQYRMCWQSPHSLDNNLLKAVNGVPRYHPSVRQTFCAMLCPCLMVFLSLGKRTNKTIFDQLLIYLA